MKPEGRLPVQSPWFRVREIAPGVRLIDEPWVHPFLRANIWWVTGADRDLVIDSGLGVASLCAEIPALFARDPLCVVTHAHLDHIGGAHEFADVAMSPAEHLHAPVKASLRGEILGRLLGGDHPMPEVLLTAAPAEGFALDAYAVIDPVITRPVADGDLIDLGDRSVEVMVLPGHTPGSVGVLDRERGAFYSGDVIYDDDLIDDLPESDPSAYARSLSRLLEAPIEVVYPGHDDIFGAERLHQLIRRYVGDHS